MSTSEGYILNALQTPRPMQPIYESIVDGNTTRGAIKTDTGLTDGIFDQAFQGLQLLRLVGREDEEYYPVKLRWSTGKDTLDFRMTMLHNLAKECSADDWGKQAVVLLSYQYLMANEIEYFKSDDQTLYERIDQWYRAEKDYDPQSSQGSITLNEPKFVNWARLASYLGLIYKASGRQHVVYPDEDIVLHSIRIASGDDQFMELEYYFRWLRNNLFQIELTNDGRVPSPLSRILYNLVRDGPIRLVERGDAGAVRLSRTPSRPGIDTESNTIEVVQ